MSKSRGTSMWLMGLSVLFSTSQIFAQTAASVIDSPLQQFKQVQSVNAAGGGTISLINLNTHVNVWYVLQTPSSNGATRNRHIESINPSAKLSLMENGHINVATSSGNLECVLPAEVAVPTMAYEAICDNSLYLRHPFKGEQSTTEWVANGLRSNFGSLGISIVEGAKQFAIPAEEIAALGTSVHVDGLTSADRPTPALLEDPTTQIQSTESNLGIKTTDPLVYGYWSRSQNYPGVYVSLMNPALISKKILNSYTSPKGVTVKALTDKELEARVYLVAMDADRFSFGYAVGSDFPEVAWSTRGNRTNSPNAAALGPDGFGDLKPLARIGSIPTHVVTTLAATFVGGFKRDHAAFKYGPLAESEAGHHYGVMENGIIMSKIVPDLATAAIDVDGQLNLSTWPSGTKGQDLLASTRHVRQNGVPVIDGIDADGISIPGKYVSDYRGNWSGDSAGDLVTVRSGLCQYQRGNKKFFIFAHFTRATPNLMARVFQAYQCNYALLLDMNAFEHTFFALTTFTPSTNAVTREYLHTGMKDAEPKNGGYRFVNRSNNRDFFYVLRKN